MVKYLEKEEDFFTITASGTLIVDFFAEWCGPCKMLANILEEIDYTDVLKVDVDKFNDLATKFGVMSIPTLLFYKDGLLMKRQVGYATPEEIKDTYNEITKEV